MLLALLFLSRGVHCAANTAVSVDGSVVSIQGLGSLQAEWLRERSLASDFVEADSLQPRFTPDEYITPQVSTARVVGAGLAQELEVTFRDGHNTSYSYSMLQRWVEAESAGPAGHARASQLQTSEEPVLPQLRPWTKATIGSIHYEQFADLTAPPTGSGDQPALRRALHGLMAEGLMIVKGVPRVEGECTKMANLLSILQVTNW
jgi:hypothetical protein